MSRPIMQDIVPKRSIRDVVIDRAAARERPARTSVPTKDPALQKINIEPKDQKKEPSVKPGHTLAGGVKNRIIFTDKNTSWDTNYRLWIVVAASLAGLYFVSSVFLSGAAVTVTPRQALVSLDANVLAYKTPEPSALGYELLTLSLEKSKELPASGRKPVEEKAVGKILIYNNHSDQPQRLIKNTRFETPDGLIFRISRSVVVPGQKIVAGKKMPGSLETEVYADQAGEKYNIAPARFTLPGLKGDARFNNFYAESRDPMSGGFKGEVNTVAKEDENKARAELREAISAELATTLKGKIPDGYVFYDDGVFFEFHSSSSDVGGASSVKVAERGTAIGIIFKKEDLSKEIGRLTVADYFGEAIMANGLEELKFMIPDKAKVIPSEAQKISFKLAGQTYIVWSFDEKRLREDLAGQHRRQITNVMSGYPAIERADVVVRPFWKKSFPKKAKEIDIKIVVKNPLMKGDKGNKIDATK